jgi:hypothetical protein
MVTVCLGYGVPKVPEGMLADRPGDAEEEDGVLL